MLKRLLRGGNNSQSVPDGTDPALDRGGSSRSHIPNATADSSSERSRLSAVDTLATPDNGSSYWASNDSDDARSVMTMETFVARNYSGERYTLSIYSTLFKSAICVQMEPGQPGAAPSSSSASKGGSDEDDHPAMHSTVPTHIPFSKSKTPYMVFNQRGVLLHPESDCSMGQEYCRVWQKILSNEQILYTLEMSNGQEPITMLNTGSKAITEVMVNNRKFTWHGCPGLASTFGSGFFELLDCYGQPVALYYSIVGKTLAKTKKVGEFLIWDMEMAPLIVTMGLVLREQEQRKNFERNHVLVTNASQGS